jgi:hypothetical protein
MDEPFGLYFIAKRKVRICKNIWSIIEALTAIDDSISMNSPLLPGLSSK